MDDLNARSLEPPVRKKGLSSRTGALRDSATAEFESRAVELQASIDAHVAGYAEAVERVVALHGNIASGTDLEIGADTRWSASWELSGRCLAECRLLVHALRGGFALEASSIVRALFEATHLLGAVAFHGEQATVTRWLAGEAVRPNKARAVMVKKQSLARTRMIEHGVKPDGDIARSGEWLYRHFSDSAHHRRGPITTSIALLRRQFEYGPHGDPVVRAGEVVEVGHVIETALIVVLDALADIVGREGLSEVLGQQAADLERVRIDHPLDALEPTSDRRRELRFLAASARRSDETKGGRTPPKEPTEPS